jgi:hypothetical protein
MMPSDTAFLAGRLFMFALLAWQGSDITMARCFFGSGPGAGGEFSTIHSTVTPPFRGQIPHTS